MRLDQEEHKTANLNECIKSTLKVCGNEVIQTCLIKENYGEIPEISGNAGQINQVFLNILMNAVQAIEVRGEIEIETKLNGDFVEASFKDNGKGIPKDKIGSIFTPFFTTKPVGTGTGLGLSISYQLIEQHGGEILVDSKVGEGTKMTVRLPISQNDKEENRGQ